MDFHIFVALEHVVFVEQGLKLSMVFKIRGLILKFMQGCFLYDNDFCQ